jgi:VHL beta domain
LKITFSLKWPAFFYISAATISAHAEPSKVPSEKATEDALVQMERDLNEGRSVEIRGENCAAEKTFRSIDDKTRTVIQIRNNTSKDVTYYWISYEGRREYKRVLKVGEAHNVRTYLTHPFIVVDGADRCLAVYQPQLKPGGIVVRD